MKEVNITTEVICTIPEWIRTGRHYSEFDVYQHPVYRLYVNSDLITERSWIYDDSIRAINEDFWVLLPEVATHTLRIEPVLRLPSQAKFLLFNPQSRSVQLKSKTRINNYEFTFMI